MRRFGPQLILALFWKRASHAGCVAGMLTGFSWLGLFAIGACGQPHVLTKYMMYRHVRDVKGILVISVLAGMVTVLLVTG
ncbi:MAG: hypothetical protein IH795_10505, partial [Bacteroidetes bacterium]|nr:hypothetical protein [Bacteroidota bacterium]